MKYDIGQLRDAKELIDSLEKQLAMAIDMRDGYHKAGNELCAEKDARIRELEEAIRLECSVSGCEGPFDDVCHEYTAPIEDWCPWCRLSRVLGSPASGGPEQ
jgi:hypothetical protein